MNKLEDQKINNINIVPWCPSALLDNVLYYKIVVNEETEGNAYDALKRKFEELPEEKIDPSWGYWDLIIKSKKNVTYVGYSRQHDHEGKATQTVDFYLMGPSGRSENKAERKRK